MKKLNYDIIKDKISDIEYSIYRWWTFTRFGSWWLDFRNGIKQLINWSKVIYNTHNYDYTDIYTLIGFKLKELGDGIEKRDLVVGCENDVKWIRVCERLCDKLKSEYYITEYFDFVENDYMFVPINTDKGDQKLYTMEKETIRDDLDDYFKLNGLSKNKVIKEIKNPNSGWVKGSENDRHFLAGRIGDHKHGKARKLLFKILESKIEGWWD